MRFAAVLCSSADAGGILVLQTNSNEWYVFLNDYRVKVCVAVERSPYILLSARCPCFYVPIVEMAPESVDMRALSKHLPSFGSSLDRLGQSHGCGASSAARSHHKITSRGGALQRCIIIVLKYTTTPLAQCTLL